MRLSTLKPRAVRWLSLSEAGKGTGGRNFGARRGEVIRGRLIRGAGGKFASIEDRMLSGEISPEQSGLEAAQSEAFAAMQKGEALSPAQAEALAAIGLVSISADGAKLTAAGVRAAKALKRGDIAAFKKQVDSAKEWKSYNDAKRAAKAGKGKAAAKSAAERAAEREAARKRTALSMLTDLGFDDKESASLYRYAQDSAGIEYDSPLAQRLVDSGILERNEDAQEIRASDNGRALMRALKSGDKAAASEALKRARAAAAEREEKALARRDSTAAESASEESTMAKRGVVMGVPVIGAGALQSASAAAAQAAELDAPASMAEGDEYEGVYVWGETTFAAIDARIAAQDGAETVEALARLMPGLVANIMMRPEITDKASALRSLAAEFGERVVAAIGDGMQAASEARPAEAFDGSLIESAEVAGALTLSEAADGGPLEVDVVLIRPGPGNPRDAHYYPADVLRRDSHVFAGAKMYETDHNPAEKSTRTWVSTVREIGRYTEVGEPVARVVVHDPGFAQRLRNLNESGLLESMACSILANGTARPGLIDGKQYNIVESITAATSVDWVTRAGAGGRAIGIAESHAEAPETETKKGGQTTEENAESGDALQESAAKPVVISERQAGEPEAAQDAGSQDQSGAETMQAAETGADAAGGEISPAGADGAPHKLSEAEVDEVAGRMRLPAAVINRIKVREYSSREDLARAIESERAYLDDVLRGGKPFAFAESAPQAPRPSAAETAQTVNRVSDRYLGRR